MPLNFVSGHASRPALLPIISYGLAERRCERTYSKRKGGKHFPGQLQIRNLGWLAEMIAWGIRELPEIPEPFEECVLEPVSVLSNPLDIGTHGQRVLCLALLGLR